MTQPLQSLAALSIFALVVVCGAQARADCLPASREVKFADGSARIKTYVCGLPGAAKPQLQVEFDSLSEAAAGSLVEQTPFPDLVKALGASRVARNEVFAETKALFDAYGTKEMVQGGALYHRDRGVVRSSDDAANPAPPGEFKERPKQTIWYFSAPDAENLTAWGMPLPDDEKTIASTTRWPSGWRFYYGPPDQCAEKGILGCTLLWRPARPADIANYMENRRLEETRRRLEEPQFDPAPGGEAPTAQEKAEQEKMDAQDAAEKRAADERTKRYLALVQHLNASGWQDDFLTITGTLAMCGGGFDFRMHVRQMRLETAFMTNLSSQPLTIGNFIGALTPSGPLRASGASPSAAASEPLPGEAITLAPGERIAVPLRILFVPAGGRDAVFQTEYLSGLRPINLPAATRIFQSIQAAKPGTMFTEKNAEDPLRALKKTRESFGAPSAPAAADLVWGLALDPRGVTLDGQRIDFDRSSVNAFTITIAGDYGSCPYLYAFDEGANAWVRHGKVIDNASGPEKERVQRIDFAGLVNRFSIREEELEVSYIRSVRLEARLRDGRVVALSPNGPGGTVSTSLAVILSGDAREYAFALPEGVAAGDVARSTLIVDGYYRRYSSVPMAEN